MLPQAGKNPLTAILVSDGEEEIKSCCSFHKSFSVSLLCDWKERFAAINRLYVVTKSESSIGLIHIRPYIQAKETFVGITISTCKILEMCFAGHYSNLLAVLTEDQSVAVWRLGDKMQLEKVFERARIENAHVEHIRWNPYRNDEIFCFSNSQLLVIKYSKPSLEMLLMDPVPEGISEVYFIPKAKKRIFFA